jgi:glyoxylase-like metal-dependent hydrolase (beta-lactamase superfamily II)
MQSNQDLPRSRHFRLEKLQDGVYAATHQIGGWAISNAGIVDLGDRTLVYDTFRSTQPAYDLRLAAEQLTGRPVSIVINSHYHADHVWGNQVFYPSADIISSFETRELIATKGIAGLESMDESAAKRVEALEEQYENAEDEGERKRLSFWIAFFKGPVEALPLLEIIPPNITFDNRYTIHGSKREVELVNYSGGHTSSDTVLYLPEEKIAFVADLLWNECHPNLVDTTPGALVGIQEQIARKGPETLVSGHGNVGTLEDLQLMVDYIADVDRLAKDLVQAGNGDEKIAEIPIPDAYATWELATFFEGNLRNLYKRRLEA